MMLVRHGACFATIGIKAGQDDFLNSDWEIPLHMRDLREIGDLGFLPLCKGDVAACWPDNTCKGFQQRAFAAAVWPGHSRQGTSLKTAGNSLQSMMVSVSDRQITDDNQRLRHGHTPTHMTRVIKVLEMIVANARRLMSEALNMKDTTFL